MRDFITKIPQRFVLFLTWQNTKNEQTFKIWLQFQYLTPISTLQKWHDHKSIRFENLKGSCVKSASVSILNSLFRIQNYSHTLKYNRLCLDHRAQTSILIFHPEFLSPKLTNRGQNPVKSIRNENKLSTVFWKFI